MKIPLNFLFLLLWILIFLGGDLVASTTLISYHPNTSPTTQNWILAQPSSYVVGSAYMDGDRPVWRLEEPGSAAVTGIYSHHFYQYNVSAAQHLNMFTNGWSLKGVMSILDDDPTHTITLAADRNSWMAYIYNLPTGGNRNMFGISLGRHADGRILVGTYNGGSTTYVSPGYHEYEIRYDALTEKGAVYIDGVFWKEYNGTELAGTGTNMVYWGDNNNQTTAVSARTTYFGDLSLTVVPEPKPTFFMFVGLLAILGRRHRKCR